MINSIDMNTMLPRTAEAADLQGREINQQQHATDQNAIQFQNLTQQEATHTVETQQSETDEYDMEGSGGRSGGRSGSSRKRKKQEKEVPMAPRSDSSFDIMV